MIAGANKQSKDRSTYAFDENIRGDTYFGVFYALKKLGLEENEFGKRAIFQKIKQIVDAGPDKSKKFGEEQVNNAVTQMAKIARDIKRDDPKIRDLVVEWNENRSAFYISDPGLKLYIQYADWERGQQYRYRDMRS